MDTRLKNTLKEEVKTIHARRYDVLYILQVDPYLTNQLKQVVNALNHLDELLDKWLFISDKIDNKTIYQKVIGYLKKYQDFDKSSYLALYNLEYTRCMTSLLKGFDYE